MDRLHRVALLALLPPLILLGARSDAAAGPVAGLGVYYGLPVGEPVEDLEPGWGFEARLGYALPIPTLRLVPEVAADYVHLPNELEANPEHRIRTLKGGLRVGFGAPLRPSLWVHGGYGWIDGEADDMILSKSGLVFDAGAALDFTATPWLNVGVYAGVANLRYDANRNDKDWEWERWVKVGLQLEGTF